MIHWYEYFFDFDDPVVRGHDVVAVVECPSGAVYLVSRSGACAGPHRYAAKRYPDGEWFEGTEREGMESAIAAASGHSRERVALLLADDCLGDVACSEPLAPTYTRD